ncbi:MAG: MYG1 family protein, partial [Verrucomicrobiota bacterium]|nr:MYG1 family protein [Verrucomicrobiota bacterium]
MSIELILTHPGGAHKDDYLACSLLVAQHGAPIERREPEQGDLDNSAVLVVDVGGEHEPERGNFDHHQFPRDHDPICALSLVLQDLGLYEDAKMFCDWLEPAEWFDTRGAGGT